MAEKGQQSSEAEGGETGKVPQVRIEIDDPGKLFQRRVAAARQPVRPAPPESRPGRSSLMPAETSVSRGSQDEPVIIPWERRRSQPTQPRPTEAKSPIIRRLDSHPANPRESSARKDEKLDTIYLSKENEKLNKPEYWISIVRSKLNEIEDKIEGRTNPNADWKDQITLYDKNLRSVPIVELIDQYNVADKKVSYRAGGKDIVETLVERLKNEIEARQALHNEYYAYKGVPRGSEIEYLKTFGEAEMVSMSGKHMNTLSRLGGMEGGNATTLGVAVDQAYRLWLDVGEGNPISFQGREYRAHNIFSTITSEEQSDAAHLLLAKALSEKERIDLETAKQAVKLGKRLVMVFGEADRIDAETDKVIEKGEFNVDRYIIRHKGQGRLRGIKIPRFKEGERFAVNLEYRALQAGERKAESTVMSRFMNFVDFRAMRVAKKRGDEVGAKPYNIPGGFDCLPKHLMLALPDMITMPDRNGDQVTIRQALVNRKLKDINWADIQTTKENPETGQKERINNIFDQQHFYIGFAARVFEELTSNGENAVKANDAGKNYTNIKRIFTPEVVAANLGIDPREVSDEQISDYQFNLQKNYMLMGYEYTFSEASKGRIRDADERKIVLSNMRKQNLITDKEIDQANKEIIDPGILKSIFSPYQSEFIEPLSLQEVGVIV